MRDNIENKKTDSSHARGIVKLSDIFIVLIGIYFFVYSTIHGTNFYQMTQLNALVYSAWGLVWNMVKLLVLIKVLIEYRSRDWKVIFLIVFSILLSLKSDGSWFTDAVWIICSLKNVNYKSLLKCVFFALMMSMACIVGLCLIGKIGNEIYYRNDGIVRYSLGYQHPNTLAIRIFELCAVFVCILQGKLRYIHSVVFFIIMFFIKYVTDSTTAVLLMGLMAFLTLFICYANNSGKKKIGYLRRFVRFWIDKMKYIVIIMPILAIFIVLNSSWLRDMVDGTLLSRIEQATFYYNVYGVKLLGSKLELNNNIKNWSLYTNLYTLDNAYMYMLLGYGIIAFVLFVYAEIKMFVLFSKEKNYAILMILALYAVYGFVEVALIRIDMNFTLLFAGICLWEYKEKTKNIDLQQ